MVYCIERCEQLLYERVWLMTWTAALRAGLTHDVNSCSMSGSDSWREQLLYERVWLMTVNSCSMSGSDSWREQLLYERVQLARTFCACVRGNNSPHQQVVLVCIGHSKGHRKTKDCGYIQTWNKATFAYRSHTTSLRRFRNIATSNREYEWSDEMKLKNGTIFCACPLDESRLLLC